MRTPFFIFLALIVVGCARNTDFLHHVVSTPPKEITTHKVLVKDLIGDSRIDILWTIDNSYSMYDDQQEVIKNTAAFMDEFTKKTAVDWKMGLLSTDLSNSPYVGFTPATMLDTKTKNPVKVFQDAVGRLGIAGSGTEMWYEPVEKAIQGNPTFLRKQAMLALIHVSDAPEQSYKMTTDAFADFLTLQKGALHRVLGYGVLWPIEWCPASSGDTTFNFSKSRYEEFFAKVKGATYSLCKADFGHDLAALGKDIVKRITSPRITLSKRPRVSTIKVVHNGVELKGGFKDEGGLWLYDFDMNAIVFHDLEFAPGEKEEVTVDYREDDGTI